MHATGMGKDVTTSLVIPLFTALPRSSVSVSEGVVQRRGACHSVGLGRREETLHASPSALQARLGLVAVTESPTNAQVNQEFGSNFVIRDKLS